MTKKVQTAGHADTEEIDNKIKDILARGNLVKFTNKVNSVVKILKEWNQDEMGDMLASYSTGLITWICPYSIYYEITEITPQEFLQLKGIN